MTRGPFVLPCTHRNSSRLRCCDDHLNSPSYVEYRTNLGAETLGNLLTKSNPLRHRAGSLWGRVAARQSVKQTLDTLEVPVKMSGLPGAVNGARFDIDRVPEEGTPAFLAIWRTALGHDGHRSMPEVTESVRIFNQGLALLSVLDLPDVRYVRGVEKQINALYRQTGEFEWGEEDSLGTEVADTVRSAVNTELARVYTDQLRVEEREQILVAYRSGEISQLVLQRGVGVYLGQITFVDSEAPPISFEVIPEMLGEVLGFAVQEWRDER
jgi:hypothetical protein